MTSQPDIDDYVRNFALFLEQNFGTANRPRGGDFESWWRDFTQANWELLVEASLPWVDRIRLEIYGEGAECHSPSSRVTFPEQAASHRIVCVARDGGQLWNCLSDSAISADRELVLDRFVALEGSWFREAPPFDMVLVYVDGVPVLVRVDSVRFVIGELPNT